MTWDELVARLTNRLRIDPELQLEVAQELRDHLEDSAAEFRKAGQDEDEAADSAAKALGEPDKLADDLWQANRRRVRLRGVLRWAARATLVPGAVIIIVALAWGLGSGWRSRPAKIVMHFSGFPGCTEDCSSLHDRLISDWGTLSELTDDQRLVLLGDITRTTLLERQKAIAERWPENPIYFANYVLTYLSHERTKKSLKNNDSETIAKVLAELDRGEKINPDNAFYNFTKAYILLEASSSDTAYSVACEDVAKQGPYVEVADQELFDRGLAEFQAGLAKPFYSRHVTDMHKLRMGLLPAPSRMGEYLVNFSLLTMSSTTLSGFHLQRQLARRIGAIALDNAEQGQKGQAVKRAKEIELLAAKMGAKAQTYLELLTALGIQSSSRRCLEDIYNKLDMPEEASATRDKIDAARKMAKSSLDSSVGERLQPHAGFLQAPTIGDKLENVNLEPMRTAVYAIYEQIALLALLVFVTLFAIIACVMTGFGLVFRRQEKPKLLFVGWGRLASICFYAIILPLTLYVFYIWLAPFNGREYAAWYARERVLLEIATLLVSIIGLLIGLSYSAIRRRAEELNISVPQPLRLRNRRVFFTIALLLTCCILGYIVCWELGLFLPTQQKSEIMFINAIGLWGWQFPGYGFILTAILGGFFLIWMCREFVRVMRLGREFVTFRRSLFRSVIGILAAAVIVVGVLFGVTLRRMESQAVSRITGSAHMGLHNEIEMSKHYSQLRAEFAQLHEELMSQRQSGSGELNN